MKLNLNGPEIFMILMVVLISTFIYWADQNQKRAREKEEFYKSLEVTKVKIISAYTKDMLENELNKFLRTIKGTDPVIQIIMTEPDIAEANSCKYAIITYKEPK